MIGFDLISEAFVDKPDPASYVAREVSERALSDMLDGVRRPQPVALLGSPGVGKTLVLRTLATRLDSELRGVYVPNPVLDPGELATWTLGSLGAAGWSDPLAVLRAYAAHLANRSFGLVLLIDDAHCMPLETVRWLGEVTSSWGGALRVVVAGVDDERCEKRLAAFGAVVRVEWLQEPMSLSETQLYVAERLARSGGLGSEHLRCDESALREIHRASGGVPREVSAAVSALLQLDV